MATTYFVTSVADAWLYDFNDVLVGTSKVLMDSSIELTTSSTDVRGGKGNALQFIYWHSGDLAVTLTDTQFNLDFLEQAVGSSLATGANVYTEETITLAASEVGTIVGTPIVIQGSVIYGWVTHDGVDVPERVVFTGQSFTSTVGAENDVVCVRYYHVDSAAKHLDVYSNVIPNKLRLVLDAQLADKGATSASVIGKVEFIVPTFQVSGSWSLAMTADQVMQTPITGRALETNVTSNGCAASGVLAYIDRIVDSALWYDDVEGISIIGGDLALTHPTTSTVVVKAVHTDGSVSTPPPADLTFASGTVGTATIGANTGILTTVAAGPSLITATITAKPAMDAAMTLTVS